MPRITVVGKNSFMAKSVRDSGDGAEWRWISHREAMDGDEWLNDTDCLINFSYAPELRRGEYDATLDIDTKLAEKIKNHNIHYIMLSSRMVYGVQNSETLREDMSPTPQNPYGRNKEIIENNLLQILGQGRVTILRLSNIFGFEPERASFFGMALTKLKQDSQITYDMSPFTKRDFMSIWQFGKNLSCIAQNPAGGIFNLGSGIGLETGWVAQWLIDGYGDGALFVNDMSIRDVFWLDMDKTQNTFSLPVYELEDLKQDCLRCGEQMKEYKG